ncbi:transglutaminase [Paenibacillus sp. FSL R7-277]|uniref:transglutaminase domain-containing protein n=1 Tax=Paenibacillus sp. FSL R7-277 TaxID=1227352 RepID=UPI0003E1FEDE|nr:transglutaminase domain-containing protein [Paenibacillus sp. FSL R7-277]ETT79608.1 transglutaminase [Paenibacillus sp. FSL R7-277]
MKVKQMAILLLIMCVILTGCMGGSKEGSPAPSSSPAATATAETKNTSGNPPPEASQTVYDLKQKYDSDEADHNPGIMPMYNVEQDMEFIFRFNTDLGSEAIGKTLSVHTDIEALPESKVATLEDSQLVDGKSVYSIKPLGFGVLPSDSLRATGDSSWGNAPVYYIRLNYDLDAKSPTLLKQPVIIPFTVKSDLPTPTLQADISPDGRLTLVWNEVPGAESYNIYSASHITMENINEPLSGAEQGYADQRPLKIATVQGNAYNDFMKDGRGALGIVDETITSVQNNNVQGEYYVTAVQGDKESRFSRSVDTVALSKRLPRTVAPEDNINLKLYKNAKELPKTVPVQFIDGSKASVTVMYDTGAVTLKASGPTDVPYTIQGTALKGYVQVTQLTEADITSLAAAQSNKANPGYVEPQNDTDYVPAPDVPTIIDNNDNGNASEPGDNVIDQQKENTKSKVEEGNKQAVPGTTIRADLIHADSALEEYLALTLMNGDTEISLQAFPEAQNARTLVDVIEKVVYQNPLILGFRGYGYDYEKLTLNVKYDDSAEIIRSKQKEILAEADKVIAAVIKEGMSADEKQMAIYDYLNDNTAYDDAALENAMEQEFKTVDAKYNDSFNTYGILVKKVGVCMSYAHTFQLLSDLVQVPSMVVTGTMSGVNHAWNKVKIGDEWVNVDPTNNATNTGLPYLLYNSNDATASDVEYVMDKGYWLDHELPLFKSTSNAYDYYVTQGLEVDSLEAYKTKLAEQLKKGETLVVLRVLGNTDSSELMQKTAEVIKQHDAAKLDSAGMVELGSYVAVQLDAAAGQ